MCDPGKCQWQRFEDSDRSVLRITGEVCVSCGATQEMTYRYVDEYGRNHNLENRDGKLQCCQCGIEVRREGYAVVVVNQYTIPDGVEMAVDSGDPVCCSPKWLPNGLVT